MQLNVTLPKIAAVILLGGLAQASPIRCPDVREIPPFSIYSITPRTRTNMSFQSTRDAILRGDVSPEACCSYGVCVGEVVAKMAEWEKDDSSALKWNNGRWGYR